VVEDFGGGIDYPIESVPVSYEIGCEHLDRSTGTISNRQYALIKVFASSVGQVVSSHRGDDYMPQSKPRGGLRDTLRLV
jgi:hypothetical protein